MSNKSVFIIEDDVELRESLRDALEDEGYVVHCAANGLLGLELLERFERPCVVVLDLIMPVMTGNEMYDAMQADPRFSDIPVVVSTSDPSRAPSGVLILKKPVRLQTILTTIGSLC